jgi:ABC-type branched-subunit amino acid transport system substrate-binding protein
MNRGKSLLVGSLAFVLAFSTRAVQADLGEFRIGILQELSGPVAPLGATCGRGIEVAVKSFAPGNKIGRIPVKLLVADVHNDAKAAV